MTTAQKAELKWFSVGFVFWISFAAAFVCVVPWSFGVVSVERGMELGVDDYVTKPFDPLDLIARVNTLLARNDNSEASRQEPEGGAPEGEPPPAAAANSDN